jgi:hypothetical protein
VEDTDPRGLDVVLVWGCLAVAAAILCTRRDAEHAAADRLLTVVWALVLSAFVVLAGAAALAPGYERFALCLIAPTILLAARGAARLADASPVRRVGVFAAATLLGWVLLADFQRHYFDFPERTGGNSHLTFRSGRVEPKQAALASILRRRGVGDVWIVASQWWNYWPLRYLAADEPGVHVAGPMGLGTMPPESAIAEGRAWYVEFCDTEGLTRIESRHEGRGLARQYFRDFAGRPVLCVLHPQ